MTRYILKEETAPIHPELFKKDNILNQYINIPCRDWNKQGINRIKDIITQKAPEATVCIMIQKKDIKAGGNIEKNEMRKRRRIYGGNTSETK